ncbi:MAG: M13 family metallopeptidase [Flavobacterium sp.]|nr:M13 family metallopeptidase [Flavobacterium sp.]
MKLFKALILMLSISILFLSCKKFENKFDANLLDVLSTNRDTLIDPSDDFFGYANNGWFKKNPIPQTEKSNGIFRTIQDTINNQIKQICEKAATTNDKKGTNKQKIGDFYASGMDTISINKLEINPLKFEFSKIDLVNNTDNLIIAMAHLHTIGADPAFSFYVSQDDKISSQNAIFLSQGGLGLGNRDYYFNTDKQTVTIRNAYLKHLQTMNNFLVNEKNISEKNAQIILKIETNLAKYSRKLEDLRDPVKNYNKITVGQLNQLTPQIKWNKLFPILRVSGVDSIIVGQPEFFVNLNKMIQSYSINEWKIYLKWNLLNSYASYLNSDIEKENFTFYSTILEGITKQNPRWKRVVEQTNNSLGELIGQVYVNEYCPKGTKDKLLDIGNNIKTVFALHIKKLDWMSQTTKTKALSKLDKIVMKVGYPDKWKDLSSINIDKKSYCKNIMEVNNWYYNYMIQKYHQPVDRNEWSMQPQTYNAYYNPSNNEIVVPACNILVPGFEGRMPDDAVLYGIIGGSTFGHEITHGFDDTGSQFDENGNLNNWWTPKDLKKFKAKTKLIVQQFNKFEALPNKFVNGEATQGENIADLGGVVMGYEAFKKTSQFKENKIIGKLNPDKRFFLAYGYAWMVNIKNEALSNQLMSDVHAPAKYRINGPLTNIPEFLKAFNIKKGSPMYQDDLNKIVIW